MSEDYYEYDDDSASGTESEGDEFYYEDDSNEEIEGGAYELATDYIDGMGYGGVLIGGSVKKKKVPAKKKRCLSDYNLFFKKYRSAPYSKTPEQIAKLWRSGKGKMPARKAPKGRKLCGKQKNISGSKKSVKRKQTSVKKSPVKRTVRRGTLCKENGRYYKKKRNYDLYCKDPRVGLNPIMKEGEKYYYNKICKKGQRYCPITGKCRRIPSTIVDCYNMANIPYVYNKAGIPSGIYDPYTKLYMTPDTVSAYMGDEDIYLRNRIIKKKNN